MIIVIFTASMLVEIVIGLPITVALLLYVVATALVLGGGDTDPTIIVRTLMQGSDSVTMMVLPFFVLAGEIMSRGGLTKHIIAFCDIFIGRVHGGSGYVTILACLIFASLVGSAVAACAALGAILVPIMANSGYNREKAAAFTAGANLVAPIMPPSVPMIVYSIAAGISTKSLFMGDIAPTVYLTIIANMVWFFISHEKSIMPGTKTISKPIPREAVKITLTGLWALLLPVITLVGLRSDYLTATEAGVIACICAILIGLFVCREMKIKDLMKAFIASAKIPTVVMFLAAAANCAAYFMTISRIPQMMTSGPEGLVEKPTLLMFVLICIIVVVGLAMDVVPSILILTPIILPLAKVTGIDPMYFGIAFVLMNVLGLTSPPVEPVLSVVCVTGKVRMDEIILPTMPYSIAQTILCFLPALALAFVEVPLRWLGG